MVAGSILNIVGAHKLHLGFYNKHGFYSISRKLKIRFIFVFQFFQFNTKTFQNDVLWLLTKLCEYIRLYWKRNQRRVFLPSHNHVSITWWPSFNGKIFSFQKYERKPNATFSFCSKFLTLMIRIKTFDLSFRKYSPFILI